MGQVSRSWRYSANYRGLLYNDVNGREHNSICQLNIIVGGFWLEAREGRPNATCTMDVYVSLAPGHAACCGILQRTRHKPPARRRATPDQVRTQH